MHTNRRKKSSSRSLIWAILVALLLIAMAIVESRGSGKSIQQVLKADELPLKNETFASYSVNDTLSALDEWSDALLDTEQAGVKWTFRWDFSLKEHNMEQLAQLLFVDEYNYALNKIISQEGKYITGAIPAHNGKLTLQQVENEEGLKKVVAILLLEHNTSKHKKLKSFVKQTDSIMSDHAKDISFSAKVTGSMQDDAAKRIEQVTQSSKVEEYKDEAMKVITAYSPKIKKSYWLSNNKMVNLQYAMYVDKNTEDSILTLAIPLISGEFGETLAN